VRIGIDARLTHYRQAGISRYTSQLVEALARQNPTDEFVLLQSFRSREPLVQHPAFVRRSLYTPAHHRLEQLTLPLEISKFGLNLLHSPDFMPPFRRNCRSVITIHDLAFLLYPHFLTKESAWYYGQIDEAVRRTDAIIAVSEATKNDVVRLLGVPESRVTVVYEAASSVFKPMDRAEAAASVREHLHLRGEYIFFISTIEPRKNVPTLLKAFHKMQNDYHLDLQLVISGDKGWLYDEVFQLVTELGLVEDVVFTGRVSTDDLVRLYNGAQALVAPSIYEGFGLTPLEAMACGTPVIVSNGSSFPEVVGDAGLLVDPYDVEQLAVAMWRVVSDEALHACLAAKGLARASLFSWDRAAKETLELYHRLA